ncbi:MAG: hypothetical protein RIQ89_528, partial [Bacteroidota bacterium]
MHASPYLLDNGIVPSDLIENNQARVNNLYYNTIGSGRDEITSEQADSILAIAIQCPLLGGSAVYDARALYTLYDLDMDYNDELTCLQVGLVMRKKQVLKNGITATVYPNPAKEKILVNYNIINDGHLKIISSIGKQIKELPLDFNSSTTEIDVTKLEG